MLLEPVMNVEVVTPDEYMGDVIGDLRARRGKVVWHGGARVAYRPSPLRCRCATMFGYATEVRSMTQGRATYTMEFSRYAPVPTHVTRVRRRAMR